MKITVTVSHDFESVQAAIAFAAKLEPITKELEAEPAEIAAAPVVHHIEANNVDNGTEQRVIDAVKHAEARASAETLNPSLKDRIDEIEETAKRKRRTKAEMEAARAAEAAKAEAAPVPVEAPKPAPAVVDTAVLFDEPVEAPAVKAISDADFKIAFENFVKNGGSDWRTALVKILKDNGGVEKVSAIAPDRRCAVVAAFNAHVAAVAA